MVRVTEQVMTSTIEPLDEYEAAALRRTLRELGQLNRFDAVARDFAERGAPALIELGNDGKFDAEDAYNAAYFEITMKAHSQVTTRE